MVLTVKDRLILGAILPAQGDFPTLKIVRKLQEDLSFSEEEHKLLKFQVNAETSMTTWDVEADKTVLKDVAIGEKATDIIKEAFRQLESTKPPKLSMVHIDLYEKFMYPKSE